MELSKEDRKTVEAEIVEAVKKACDRTGIRDNHTKAKLEKAIHDIFYDDVPIYKTLGASDEFMEKGYTLGYDLYKSGKYKDALVIFRSLQRNDGLNARYYYSVGACHHQLKDYEAATIQYHIAAYLDTHDPMPCYHMYECCIHLNDPFSAAFALEMVLERTKDKPNYEQLFDMSKIKLDELIKNNKK